MALGKWHLTPYTAYTSAGPFDRWPLGMGFEKYYGFLGGETDQWAPLLVQDNHFIDTPTQARLSPDRRPRRPRHRRHSRPAAGEHGSAVLRLSGARRRHAPLHAPKEFIAKYRGKFDQGWDKVREETFERQKQLGIIPKDAVLPPPNPGIQAWSDLNDSQKQGLYCRLQEVFAGFLDHADHQLGPAFRRRSTTMGIRDNTLIMVVSDNGASQEGLQNGTAEYRPLPELLPRHGRGDGREARRGRRAVNRPALPDGLGDGRQRPAEALETGHARRRQHRPLHRLLAGEDQGRGRHPQPVPPHRRRRSDPPRGERPARADIRQRRRADAASRRVSMAYTFDDAERQDPEAVAVLRDARQPGASGPTAGRP